jgi:hypothetical protein
MATLLNITKMREEKQAKEQGERLGALANKIIDMIISNDCTVEDTVLLVNNLMPKILSDRLNIKYNKLQASEMFAE